MSDTTYSDPEFNPLQTGGLFRPAPVRTPATVLNQAAAVYRTALRAEMAAAAEMNAAQMRVEGLRMELEDALAEFDKAFKQYKEEQAKADVASEDLLAAAAADL